LTTEIITNQYEREVSSSDLLWAGYVMRSYWFGSLLNEDGGKDIHKRYTEFKVMAETPVRKLLDGNLESDDSDSDEEAKKIGNNASGDDTDE
jgi:hypothetical protein